MNINKSKSPLLEFGAKEIILILDDKVEGRSRPLWMLGCRDDERSKTGLISIHFVQFLNEDDERDASRPKCKAVHDFDIDLNKFSQFFYLRDKEPADLQKLLKVNRLKLHLLFHDKLTIKVRQGQSKTKRTTRICTLSFTNYTGP